ncbi:hypothetical protein JCM11641_007258 [Rhodosporidiobolus odoratus]
MSSYLIPYPGVATPTFRGSTLIYPQPSLASLAQLAADLVLWNSDWNLVGYVGLQDFVPAVGGKDSLPSTSSSSSQAVPEGFAFGVEVYQHTTLNLTLVFPRSPVIRARRPHHLEAIKQWTQEAGFETVLVVAGVDAGLRGDEALLSSTPLRHYLPSSSSSASSTPVLTRLSSLIPSYISSSSSSATSTSRLPLFPHSGLTRKLLETFSPSSSESEKAPHIAALTIYTAEGDASEGAFLLAEVLSEVLGLPLASGGGGGVEGVEEKVGEMNLDSGAEVGEEEGTRRKRREWKTPKSWEKGLMGIELGREVGAEMYG